MIIVAEKSGNPIAQGHDACSGKCRKVHNHIRFIFPDGIGKSICEDQPPFCIGITHLDRNPRIGRNHVAGFLCCATGHIVRCRNDPDNTQRKFHARSGFDRPDHRCSPRHIGLHIIHTVGRLDRNTTGVECHSLTDKQHRFFRFRGRGVIENGKCRRLLAALVDRKKSAHTETFNLGFFEDCRLVTVKAT